MDITWISTYIYIYIYIDTYIIYDIIIYIYIYVCIYIYMDRISMIVYILSMISMDSIWIVYHFSLWQFYPVVNGGSDLRRELGVPRNSLD